MRSDFFQRTFRKAGIEVVVPNQEEIEFGTIKEDTRAGFLRILSRIETEQQIEGVILGCTELPMLLKPEDFSLHYIDTTAIHIAAIVDRCTAE